MTASLTTARAVDVVDHIHAGHDSAEDRVLRRGGLVPEVQEAVVHSVDEELASTALGLACSHITIRHELDELD